MTPKAVQELIERLSGRATTNAIEAHAYRQHARPSVPAAKWHEADAKVMAEAANALGDLLAEVDRLTEKLTLARNTLGNISGMCSDGLPLTVIDEYALKQRHRATP